MNTLSSTFINLPTSSLIFATIFSLEQLESFVGSEKMAIVNSKRLYGDFPPAALVRAALDTKSIKQAKFRRYCCRYSTSIEDVRAAHKELLKDPDLRDAKRESEIDRMHFSIKSSARLARYLTQNRCNDLKTLLKYQLEIVKRLLGILRGQCISGGTN